MITGSAWRLVVWFAWGSALIAHPAFADDAPTAPALAAAGYTDVRGVVHAHSHFSHDSEGTAERIIASAAEAGLDFLIMTDHQNDAQSVAEGLRGRHGRTLFVVGAEVGAGDGASLLAFPLQRHVKGNGRAGKIADANAQGAQAWIGHAEGWDDWDLEGVTGVELYNLHHDALLDGKKVWGLAGAARWILRDADRAMKQVLDRPDDIIRKWDRVTQRRRMPIIAGNDSHENVRVLGIQLDAYPRSYRFVNTHALVRGELTERKLLEALAAGHGYLCHELIAPGTGFSFCALDTGGATVAIMGDELTHTEGLTLQIASPAPAWLHLLRNGRTVRATAEHGTSWRYTVTEPGVYRVELEITDPKDGDRRRPWIYSNPIYVRPAPARF